MRHAWLVVAACGSSPAPIDAPPFDATAGFTLTSPSLADGAAFQTTNTCDGANVSPALAWSGQAAPGYAVTLTDQSIGLLHWAIYDIAGEALPADVDKGAQPADVPGATQVASFDTTTLGYLGPCPPSQHTYQFVVYALDAATLPGAIDRANAVAVIQQHATAQAALTGTYARP